MLTEFNITLNNNVHYSKMIFYNNINYFVIESSWIYYCDIMVTSSNNINSVIIENSCFY